MNYLLNLELPLWWFFLPLIVAGLLAANLYRVQNIFSKVKANYQLQLREAQNRLDEALNNEAANIERLVSVHSEKFHIAESVLEASRVRAENYMSLSEMYKKQTEKDAEIIRNLNARAVERELLIKTLRADIANENEILSGRIADKNIVIEQLKSKLQLSELAHNETQAHCQELIAANLEYLTDLEGLEQQFTEALAVINRTKRATKQWDKIMKDKAVNVVNTVIEAVKQKQQAETVTHDILGVPRIVKADQSENDNGRHDVMNICDEVNRGVKEQAELIKKELQQVDMSQLDAGDSVKFRNKETKTIIGTFNNGALGRPYGITVNKGTSAHDLFYDKNGRYDCVKHSYDIIQIIKQPNFDPQVGEKVGIVDSHREFIVVEIGKNKAGYMIRGNGFWNQYKPIQDITPLPNHIYKNGFVCTK